MDEGDLGKLGAIDDCVDDIRSKPRQHKQAIDVAVAKALSRGELNRQTVF